MLKSFYSNNGHSGLNKVLIRTCQAPTPCVISYQNTGNNNGCRDIIEGPNTGTLEACKVKCTELRGAGCRFITFWQDGSCEMSKTCDHGNSDGRITDVMEAK